VPRGIDLLLGFVVWASFFCRVMHELDDGGNKGAVLLRKIVRQDLDGLPARYLAGLE
jgi:hypothetical protein